MKFPTPVYHMKLVSSLTKVFPDEEPKYQPECLSLTALKNETVSFQVAYTGTGFMREQLHVSVLSPLQPYIHVRTVENVPVGRAYNGIADDNYLKTTSGMYPDLLRELKNESALIYTKQWRSLWIDVEVSELVTAGTYSIEIQLQKENEVVCNETMNITIYEPVLPKQTLMHTEWMHADCLADYYHVQPF
ncbi:MAG: hypothetical protein RR593_07895, partial [Hungatella sp.]